MTAEERCNSCPYLIEDEDGVWRCDIDYADIHLVKYCEAVEMAIDQ